MKCQFIEMGLSPLYGNEAGECLAVGREMQDCCFTTAKQAIHTAGRDRVVEALGQIEGKNGTIRSKAISNALSQ